MRGMPLIKIGSLVVFFLLSAYASGAVLETIIDDKSIPAGEATTLRIKISGDLEEITPVKYPSVPGLTITYSGMQRSYQMINGKSWSGIELVFTIEAHRAGQFRIPPFIFEAKGRKYKSSEITFKVSASAPKRHDNQIPQDGIDINPRVEVSSKRCYVGQPIMMRYYISGDGARYSIEGFEKLPETKGFVQKMFEGDASESDDGKPILTYALVPTSEGRYSIGGGSAVVAVEGSHKSFGGFNFPMMTEQKRLVFENVDITVIPIPKNSMPDGFHGDVGSFRISADYSPEDVKVYEEKKVTVMVRGEGNLLTLSKPICSDTEGIKIIMEDGESKIAPNVNSPSGEKKIIYTIISEKPGKISVGPIKLVFFNPNTSLFETASTQNITFNAKGEAAAKNSTSFDESEEKMAFNPYIITIIALAVAAAVISVIIWERRRYHIIHKPKAANTIDTEKAIIKSTDIVTDLNYAFEQDESNNFLRLADKAISELLSRTETSRERMKQIKELRDELNQLRFGGYTADKDKMKMILDRINDFL
jgi:hypothetical protein